MAKKQPAPTPASGGVLLQPGDMFLDTAQAAHFLGRSSKTLEYWRLVGGGPRFYKQGRRIRYLKSELTSWALQYPVDVLRPAAGIPWPDAQKVQEWKSALNSTARMLSAPACTHPSKWSVATKLGKNNVDE